MTLVVDITHWLDSSGNIPTANPNLRRQALHVARLIEAGGPLASGQHRETLVECSRRPARKPCPGLLWVTKTADDRIEAYCLMCEHVEAIISQWQDTIWAQGPMPPVAPPV